MASPRRWAAEYYAGKSRATIPDSIGSRDFEGDLFRWILSLLPRMNCGLSLGHDVTLVLAKMITMRYYAVRIHDGIATFAGIAVEELFASSNA